MTTAPALAVWLDSYGVALRPALQQATEGGFHRVHATALRDLDAREFTRSARRHLGRHLRDLGLQLGSLTLDFSGRGLAEPDQAADRVERLAPTLELCRDLGVAQAGVTLAGFHDDRAGPLALELLEVVADVADRFGVPVAVRDPTGALNRDPAPLRALRCPQLLLAADTAAMPRTTEVADSLDLVATAYLRDIRQHGTRHEEVPYGQGDVDFPAWLAGLATLPRRPELVVRRDAGAGVDALRQGREYIESLMAGSRSG